MNRYVNTGNAATAGHIVRVSPTLTEFSENTIDWRKGIAGYAAIREFQRIGQRFKVTKILLPYSSIPVLEAEELGSHRKHYFGLLGIEQVTTQESLNITQHLEEPRKQMPFFSTKRFGPISTGHRQWRDNGHCAYLHGYGRTVKVVFGCHNLDDKSWVVDFGALRSFKSWLEGEWDHRMLIASNDPELETFKDLHERKIIDLNILDAEKGYGPGIEASCLYVYDYLNKMVETESNNRCWVQSVEIWEHENNSAIYTRP